MRRLFLFVYLLSFLLILLLLTPPASALFGKGKEEKEKKAQNDEFMEGMQSLGENMKDPAYLKHTMDSLNDPAVRAEVQKMMQDPDFRNKIEKLKVVLAFAVHNYLLHLIHICAVPTPLRVFPIFHFPFCSVDLHL